MKPLAECLELIQGKKLDEFIQLHPHPVLIGLGVIGSDLQKNPAKAAGTMFVNLSAMPATGDNSPQVNQVFELVKSSVDCPSDGIYIGSGPEYDICIPDSSISKTHAHFIQGDAGFSIVDHGSLNGSYINGARVTEGLPTPLKGGDILTLGRISFTFYDATSFAKLLAVQAMARGRQRKIPRTPGAARSETPSLRSTPTVLPGRPPAATAPWAQNARGGNIRRTGLVQTPPDPDPWQPAGPPTGEWRQRAVGRIPQQEQLGREAPPQAQIPQRPLVPQTQQAPSGSRAPAPPQTSQLPAVRRPPSWFARLILRFSKWLQRLVGE